MTMSTMQIDRKIVGYRVEGSEEKTAAAASAQSQSQTPAAGSAAAATTGRDKAAAPQKAAERATEKVGERAGEKPPEKPPEKPARRIEADGKVVRMHEKLERPEMLLGSTYKVKTPVSDHAMYVTINDIVLNQGTEYEQRRPFEIFINSKNLDHYQWIVALTRLMSAVFRKGGDVTFMVDELKAVFDPRGGYWAPGGRFMPSIIAELGHIVEKHLRYIGLLPADSMDEQKRKLIEQKRREFEEQNRQQDAFAQDVHAVEAGPGSGPGSGPESGHGAGSDHIPGGQQCPECYKPKMVLMDGCMTCLECGYSKCG